MQGSWVWILSEKHLNCFYKDSKSTANVVLMTDINQEISQILPLKCHSVTTTSNGTFEQVHCSFLLLIVKNNKTHKISWRVTEHCFYEFNNNLFSFIPCVFWLHSAPSIFTSDFVYTLSYLYVCDVLTLDPFGNCQRPLFSLGVS